jgi:O-antigen/teichoic acid export membrane protein
MSGNEKRLVRIQLVAGVVTVSCCFVLVPRWGIAGAAVAAALGNAGTNAWCLWEVKKVLGLFPYNRGYWRLALPTGAAITTAIGLRIALRPLRPDILVVIVATMAVYAVFAGAVLLTGLEADDRLIAAAIWARVRGLFPGSQAGAA